MTNTNAFSSPRRRMARPWNDAIDRLLFPANVLAHKNISLCAAPAASASTCFVRLPGAFCSKQETKMNDVAGLFKNVELRNG